MGNMSFPYISKKTPQRQQPNKWEVSMWRIHHKDLPNGKFPHMKRKLCGELYLRRERPASTNTQRRRHMVNSRKPLKRNMQNMGLPTGN